MENKEIARVLWETADLMEIAAEDSFRIRSYRNGATAIEGYPGAHRRHPARPRAQGHRHLRHRQRPGRRAGGDRRNAAPASGAICCSQNFRPPRSSSSRSRGSAPRASRSSSNTTASAPSTNWSASAASRNCACCRAWAPSSKRRCCAPSPQYRQRSGRYLLSYAEAWPPNSATMLAPGAGRGSRHPRRQPAARARDGGRSRPAGHRPRRHRRARYASSPIRAWRKCSAAAKIRPAPKWAARACRWTCAPCRPTASAPPCSISPAAKTTTSPSARAP